MGTACPIVDGNSNLENSMQVFALGRLPFDKVGCKGVKFPHVTMGTQTAGHMLKTDLHAQKIYHSLNLLPPSPVVLVDLFVRVALDDAGLLEFKQAEDVRRIKTLVTAYHQRPGKMSIEITPVFFDGQL